MPEPGNGSPLHPLHLPLFEEKGVEVVMKRDDMIHPYISGNKWRKLKYLLIRSAAEKRTHLVTFGGAWSNHLLAVACAAAVNGYRSTGFVRGEQNNNLVSTLCKLFGMHLIFVSRSHYLDKEKLFLDHFGSEPGAFFIPEGGAGPEAAKGCAELIAELEQPFDHLFCAAGTGTTAAGLINGVARAGTSSIIHAVSVLKGDFLGPEIEKLLEQPSPYLLHTGYHFGGYAKTNPELVTFIREFTAATGILLDPVYTGKLLYCVTDLVNKDYFKRGEKIVVVHTGGLTGIAGKLDEFADL